MHVWYWTKDLFFSSRVSSVARQAGVTVNVRPAVDPSEIEEEAALGIIDLGLPGLDIAVAVRQIRETASQLKILAYGAHVDESTLAAAKQAGCDWVLPRSQFDRQIVAILREVKTPPGERDLPQPS